MTRLAELFPIILGAIVWALILGPGLLRLGNLLGFVDLPGAESHKHHEQPTPMIGGLLLVLSIGLSFLIVGPPVNRSTLGILLSGSIVLVWGLVDDRVRLPALAKLFGQILATLILWQFGVNVRIFNSEIINLFITLVWVVGLTNAFNFVDSMDGLALGLAAIGAGFFMLVNVDSQQPELAHLSAALLGAAGGAYIYNASPSRMFLGDSGAQFLGFVLAAVGIGFNPIGLSQAVSWFTPALVLGVPIFDMTLVILSRSRHRRRVYQAHRDHVYHRLVGIDGLDETRAVLVMQLAAVLLGLVAFIALDASPLVANLIFSAVVVGGLSAIVFLERYSPYGSRS